MHNTPDLDGPAWILWEDGVDERVEVLAAHPDRKNERSGHPFQPFTRTQSSWTRGSSAGASIRVRRRPDLASPRCPGGQPVPGSFSMQWDQVPRIVNGCQRLPIRRFSVPLHVLELRRTANSVEWA